VGEWVGVSLPLIVLELVLVIDLFWREATSVPEVEDEDEFEDEDDLGA
jgi:hypothetical protein